MEKLHQWKAGQDRKPLIIRGARQVGKTWLMKEFGRTAFPKTVYIGFDNNQRMKELFSSDMDVDRIVTGLELYAGQKIDPENTLLIFDEVQDVPNALTSLKYFHEDAPQYQIVCAGSLLGIALHPGTSFPVGKVEFLDLYPLSFSEFMRAMGNGRFVELLQNGEFDMVTDFRQAYTDMLKHYYYIGGMPEVVHRFAGNRDFNEARKIQQRILDAYEQDFSKHAPHDSVPRIRMLWDTIPAQLTKENKKFFYGQIREGARSREYEQAMLWLTDCGLIHKVHRVTAPRLPLKAYEDQKSFKLFLLDVGLLSCMVRLGQRTLLEGNEIFKEFKGALTEQYVLQQLKTVGGLGTYYWTNERGGAEIDFVVDTGDEVIPLEVKAERNLKAKSLKVYQDRFHPRWSVRTSMAEYKREARLLNLPLYAIERIRQEGSEGS